MQYHYSVCQSNGLAGAYPSSHWPRGGVHPGLFASQSQGLEGSCYAHLFLMKDLSSLCSSAKIWIWLISSATKYPSTVMCRSRSLRIHHGAQCVPCPHPETANSLKIVGICFLFFVSTCYFSCPWECVRKSRAQPGLCQFMLNGPFRLLTHHFYTLLQPQFLVQTCLNVFWCILIWKKKVLRV